MDAVGFEASAFVKRVARLIVSIISGAVVFAFALGNRKFCAFLLLFVIVYDCFVVISGF